MSTLQSKESFTFKMDPTTKKDFSSLCYQIGIPMSSALNALCKQAIREQSLSFTLKKMLMVLHLLRQKELKKALKNLKKEKGKFMNLLKNKIN